MESKREPSKTKQKPGFKIEAAINNSKLPEYNGLKDPNLTGFFSGKQVKKILVKQGLITNKGHILDRHAQLPYANSKTHPKKAKDTQRSGSLAVDSNTDPGSTKKKPRTKSKLSNRSKEKLKPMTKEELKLVIQKFKPLASETANHIKEVKSSELLSIPKIDSTKDFKTSELPNSSDTESSKELIIPEKKLQNLEKTEKIGDKEISIPKEENSFFITDATEKIENKAAEVTSHGRDEEAVDEDLEEEVLSEELTKEAVL